MVPQNVILGTFYSVYLSLKYSLFSLTDGDMLSIPFVVQHDSVPSKKLVYIE
jgi:hypothetical protein